MRLWGLHAALGDCRGHHDDLPAEPQRLCGGDHAAGGAAMPLLLTYHASAQSFMLSTVSMLTRLWQ